MDNGPPTYTAKLVCTALDVPLGTLNSWAHFGYFKTFDAAEPTPRRGREFSYNDVIRLEIIRLLSNLGVSKRWIMFVLERWRELFERFNEFIDIRLLFYPNGEISITHQSFGPSSAAVMELTIKVGRISEDVEGLLLAAELGVPQNVPQT